MTRLRADFLLLLTALIWGTTFIAQKATTPELGPLGFVAARFALSFVIILPFALLESRRLSTVKSLSWLLPVLLVAFAGGVIFQQLGMAHTSVTNAGFVTSFYIVIIPFAAWVFFRKRPSRIVWIAAFMALFGIWLLNGAQSIMLGKGDQLVLACAFFFAFQVLLIGHLANRTGRPLMLSVMQYGFCALLALLLASFHETLSMGALAANWRQIAYAGILSGGIAYTLQSIAQRYTPPSHAAIIMAAEAPFAAIAAYWMLGERIGMAGWLGCGLILGAIVLAEAGALLRKQV